MPSSSDGKARARVQSVDSGVESVVVPVGGGGLSGLKGGGGRRRGNNDFYVGGDSVVAPPADHELKAAEEVARISQGDRDAEAAPAADP